MPVISISHQGGSTRPSVRCPAIVIMRGLLPVVSGGDGLTVRDLLSSADDRATRSVGGGRPAAAAPADGRPGHDRAPRWPGERGEARRAPRPLRADRRTGTGRMFKIVDEASGEP